MRIRTIKPAFFMDDRLADLDPLTRLLFIGLWCAADGVGRLKDRPKRLKAEVLPYDEIDVNAALDALQSGGWITRYESTAGAIIQVNGFEDHQRINGKEAETKSEFPPIEQGTLQQGNNGETTGKHSGNNGETVNVLEGKGMEGKGKEGTREQGAEIPSVEEVITAGDFIGCAPAVCRAFFKHYESNNLWLNKFRRPIKWKMKLADWRDREREPKQGGKGQNGTVSASMQAMKDMENVKRIEAARKRLKDKYEGHMDWSQPDKKERTRLNAKHSELLMRLDLEK